MEEPVELPTSARWCPGERTRALAESPPTPDDRLVRAATLLVLERRAEAVVALDALARAVLAYPGRWRFKAPRVRDLGDTRMETRCLAANGRDGA